MYFITFHMYLSISIPTRHFGRALVFGLTIGAILALEPILAAAENAAAEKTPADAAAEGFEWPHQPPEGCPLVRSERFVGVYFTGRRLDRNYGDTWYPSWASESPSYQSAHHSQTFPCMS